MTIAKFEESLKSGNLFPLMATAVDTLQINLGRKCNQACKHCHLNAGPNRTEMMGDDVFDRCLEILKDEQITTVDITGGAPEMHNRYKELVSAATNSGKKVMTRCNLTILLEDGYGELPKFWAGLKVEIEASLPSHQKEDTDKVRGDHVFEQSIKALKILNNTGYGMDGSGLIINLVSNPAGAFFPPPQKEMERQFKQKLWDNHHVRFTGLFSLINMPVGRFASFLKRSGNYDSYMARLVAGFNPTAAKGVMCRNLLSIGWDGRIYDCDFNQMLELPVNHGAKNHINHWDIKRLMKREIVVGQHCYGCTAGSGSSCGGSTA